MKKIKLLTILLLVAAFGFAQPRTCGTNEYMQKMMQDPALKQQYLDLQRQFENELQRLQNNYNRSGNAASPAAVIRIPVAVHYPSAGSASATLKTCLRNLAQRQVNILNADYNATNSDISLWSAASSYYPGTNIGVMNVEFVIATQNHPSGTGLVNGDMAVTFGTDFLSNADSDSTWAGYCNLVVRNIAGGVLGYSPLGGSPGSGMTVVIDNNAFGASMSGTPTSCTGYVPGAPYNLGRTLTHELGHFFNLDHTFAGCDGANCATSGDRVCDTPPTVTDYYDCVAPGSVATTCGSIPQLTMNYMDYVEDSCMYMFTAGQAARMTAWYNTVASQLTTNTLANNEVLAHNFSLSPNPNNGTFTITFEKPVNNYSVQIIDATGKLLADNEFENDADLSKTISIPNAQTGLYFVTIKAAELVVTKKVIVQ